MTRTSKVNALDSLETKMSKPVAELRGKRDFA
jgi:hypothetical protein